MRKQWCNCVCHLPLAAMPRCHMPHPRMPLGPPFAFVFPFWQAVINSIAPVLVSFDPNPFGLARALSLSRCVCGCTPPSAAPCPPLATTPPSGKLTQRQHLPQLQSGSIFWGAGGRREAGGGRRVGTGDRIRLRLRLRLQLRLRVCVLCLARCTPRYAQTKQRTSIWQQIMRGSSSSSNKTIDSTCLPASLPIDSWRNKSR